MDTPRTGTPGTQRGRLPTRLVLEIVHDMVKPEELQEDQQKQLEAAFDRTLSRQDLPQVFVLLKKATERDFPDLARAYPDKSDWDNWVYESTVQYGDDLELRFQESELSFL